MNGVWYNFSDNFIVHIHIQTLKRVHAVHSHLQYVLLGYHPTFYSEQIILVHSLRKRMSKNFNGLISSYISHMTLYGFQAIIATCYEVFVLRYQILYRKWQFLRCHTWVTKVISNILFWILNETFKFRLMCSRFINLVLCPEVENTLCSIFPNVNFPYIHRTRSFDFLEMCLFLH